MLLAMHLHAAEVRKIPILQMSHLSYIALMGICIRVYGQETSSQQIIPVKNMLQPTMGMKKLDVLDTNLNGRFR